MLVALLSVEEEAFDFGLREDEGPQGAGSSEEAALAQAMNRTLGNSEDIGGLGNGVSHTRIAQSAF